MIQPQYSIDYYISFVANFVVWIGLSFETPLIIAFLARLGVVSPTQLRRGRRYAIVILALVAAVITPTPDPFNMTLVMLPLYTLYEFQDHPRALFLSPTNHVFRMAKHGRYHRQRSGHLGSEILAVLKAGAVHRHDQRLNRVDLIQGVGAG